MKFKEAVLAVVLGVSSSTYASAATVDLGDITATGASETGTIITRVLDFWEFSLSSARSVDITAWFDVSNSNRQFEIGLYDSAGVRIGNNVNFGGTQPAQLQYFGPSAFAAGDYTLVAGAWNAAMTPLLTDVGQGGFPSGPYSLNIKVSAVPLPAGGILLATGLIGLGWVRRRKSK